MSRTRAARKIHSETLLDPLLEAIPLPAWLYDPLTDLVVDVNSAATTLYGYTRAEFLSTPMSWLRSGGMLTGSPLVEFHRTKDNGVVEVELLTREIAGSGNQLVIVIERGSGRERKAGITSEQRFRSLVEGAADIISADERFNAFMNNGPFIGYIKHADGRYVYANELMTQLFAPATGSLIGRKDDELLPVDLVEVIRKTDAEVLEKRSVVQIIEAAPTNRGEIRHWLTCKFPLPAADGELYVGGVAIDLTERLALESQLIEARDAALGSARLKSQFLANMSHEIRTPMNGVIGLLGLLLDSPLNDDQRDLAQTARGSAESLLTIINDILDFSKIEAGKLQFEVLDLDVRTVCESTIELLTDTARRKSLEIGFVADPEIPAVLRGDPGRLRQVLLNLIGNAVKFTESGGVLLQVERGEDSDAGVELRFRITDTGIGMTASARENLFRPFAQADVSTTRRFGGTGLGLAISSQLVSMMNGEIGVESEPGCGSTFWFTARFGCEERTASVVVAQNALPHVLIVEDSNTTRQTIALQLAAWKIHCDIADDGVTALRMLRDQYASGSPYDLVVSDLEMPGLDGVALSRMIGQRDTFGAPRIVLMTGSEQKFDAGSLAQIGVTACLRKPVKPAHLFSAVFGRQMTQPAATSSAVPPAPAAVPAKRRVLVADDNAINQKVVLRQLQKLGIAAEAVGNGAEALEALGRIAYDLVLMDGQMPEMDGYEAAAEIRRRESPGGRRTLVIALTASALAEDRERCLAAGMDDFLSKPVREGDLAAMLDRWLPTSTQRSDS
ncbi:MAG TPA: response regulator [Thermoanaerobaculia bacterium]|nr:response regulator [Thermoanaerobaculia bacterium]